MDYKPQGRKRKIVDGNVSEIKKNDEALQIDRVGESSNFITRLLRRIRKAKVEEND